MMKKIKALGNGLMVYFDKEEREIMKLKEGDIVNVFLMEKKKK